MKQMDEANMKNMLNNQKQPQPGDVFLLPVEDEFLADDLDSTSFLYFLVLDVKNDVVNGLVLSPNLPEDMVGPGDYKLNLKEKPGTYYAHFWSKGPLFANHLEILAGNLDNHVMKDLNASLLQFMKNGYAEKLSEMQSAHHEFIHELIEPYRLELLNHLAIQSGDLPLTEIKLDKLKVIEYDSVYEFREEPEEEIMPDSLAMAAESEPPDEYKAFMRIVKEEEIFYKLKVEETNLFSFEMFRNPENQIIIRIYFQPTEIEEIKVLVQNQIWFDVKNAFLKKHMLECPPFPADEVIDKNIFVHITIEGQTYVQAIRFIK